MSDLVENDGFEATPSRFVVGIDLGTTNCAVAYWDSERSQRIENFPVEQWVDLGTREKRELLPSFLYQPLGEESQSLGATAKWVVGGLARERGMQLPGRQITSSKSWLCHDGVDRRSPILPWQNDDGVDKLSPVEASSLILLEIRQAWDRAHKAHPLSEQDIVLTLPASFDQVARQLTIEAAAAAGLTRILPIEEPQAAFYAWLARHADSWEQQVAPGQSILVCDIGGGTTDFTLIRVRTAALGTADVNSAKTLNDNARGKLSLHRVAVGQHLILGGDNIDLALARLVEQKLPGGNSLTTRNWDALRQACRVAKETLLGKNPPPATTIHLAGSGSRLIGGGQQIEVTQDEVRACVLDGFFPFCELTARPQAQQVGFQEFGLPFAWDAAATKHLASFLWDHRRDGRTEEELASLSDVMAARPDWVLFNGGVMTSAQLQSRLVAVVGGWFAGHAGVATDWLPGVLDGERLDLAVARGATYFGQVRRGSGVEIEANLACSYYLQTSSEPPQAICVVPGSANAGQSFSLVDQAMELAVGQPVQFPVFYSTTRLADRVGETVDIDHDNFAALPPIRTVIETGSRRQRLLPVYLQVELSHIGTLQMYCHAKDSEQRWKLEFDVRGSTQTDHVSVESAANQAGVLDERAARVAHEVLYRTFVAASDVKPSSLMPLLAEALALRKYEWPPTLLRSIWASLIEMQEGRRKSPEHEARWLNLLGYTLRPGYGLAADDWRVAQTWRTVHGKLCFGTANSRNESLILWRRIAGGFTAGQQLTVYQQVASMVRAVLDPTRRGKGPPAPSTQELTELLRLVGSLELLPKTEKTQLGVWLIELLSAKKWQACRGAMLWTIARLGTRLPVYGPLNCVVDAENVSNWLRRLCQIAVSAESQLDAELVLALMQCGRRVNDRYRDVSLEVREQVIEALDALQAPVHAVVLVREGGRLESEEASQILGEALPLGLTLLN